MGGDVVVAAAQILHKRMTGGQVRAERWRFKPRIGRSRALRRPWSTSIGLFAYYSTVCSAEGTSSSRTRG